MLLLLSIVTPSLYVESKDKKITTQRAFCMSLTRSRALMYVSFCYVSR
jgi:hypothetical protein